MHQFFFKQIYVKKKIDKDIGPFACTETRKALQGEVLTKIFETFREAVIYVLAEFVR